MGIFKRKASLEKEVQKQMKKIKQQCNMLDKLQAKQITEWGKR